MRLQSQSPPAERRAFLKGSPQTFGCVEMTSAARHGTLASPSYETCYPTKHIVDSCRLVQRSPWPWNLSPGKVGSTRSSLPRFLQPGWALVHACCRTHIWIEAFSSL